MNIKITYKWLLDYLDTDATPYDLQKYLSLCGPSVETVEEKNGDYVLDIEITSNRVDMASVFGIAQEAQAILPQFGLKARLKENPLEKYRLQYNLREPEEELPLDVEIRDQGLATRCTTMVLSNVRVGQAPDVIRERLELCDIRSINNVVDISNYLMLSLGQPTHIFDYDSIGKHTMVLRESKKGESITTLDDKKITLPGGDIVIEDGNGDLIDLCGIMGGLNSSVKEATTRVVLFVQTYNKVKIRRTSMTTGQRSVAATYFEKNLDEERVIPTLAYGCELLEMYAGASRASHLQDIYPNPLSAKTVVTSVADIRRTMGVAIEADAAATILENLGFTVKRFEDNLEVGVPSWRRDDIDTRADIVEEVARVFGYFRLPNDIQKTGYIKQPRELEQLFHYQIEIKKLLRDIGLNEVMNYSMISEDLIRSLNGNPADHLFITNTISEEIKYLRTSLVPSLIKDMKDNEGRRDTLRFFEIAKVYHRKQVGLPDEQFCLGIAVNTDFWELKGIVERIFAELHVQASFKTGSHTLLSPNMQADVLIEGDSIGTIGKVRTAYKDALGLLKDVYVAELSFMPLIQRAKLLPTYVPPTMYSVIKLDYTLPIKRFTYEDIVNAARNASQLVLSVELIDRYKDNITLRFMFGSRAKNITEQEAKTELERIKSAIETIEYA